MKKEFIENDIGMTATERNSVLSDLNRNAEYYTPKTIN